MRGEGGQPDSLFYVLPHTMGGGRGDPCVEAMPGRSFQYLILTGLWDGTGNKRCVTHIFAKNVRTRKNWFTLNYLTLTATSADHRRISALTLALHVGRGKKAGKAMQMEELPQLTAVSAETYHQQRNVMHRCQRHWIPWLPTAQIQCYYTPLNERSTASQRSDPCRLDDSRLVLRAKSLEAAC